MELFIGLIIAVVFIVSLALLCLGISLGLEKLGKKYPKVKRFNEVLDEVVPSETPEWLYREGG